MIKAIAGSAAVVGAINMVKNSLDGAISRYDTLNNFPRVLQMMGFDAKESQGAIERLSDGIDGLPTTLDDVASTTQRLATMTGDLDGAVETTIALNNAFLASGSSSADASRGLEQFTQMLATGTVDMQSWRTLQETMPIALNKTAEAFGFAGESAQNDLYAALKEGDITFSEFNDQLVELSNETGGFADMARENSDGIATSWQNMKTAVVKGVTDVIASIDEALGGVGSISGIIDTIKSGIQTVFAFISTNIPIVAGWINTVVEAIRGWLPPVNEVKSGFMVAFETIYAFVMPIVQEIVSFIMEVWGGLVSWWQANGEMIMQAVSNVVNFIWMIIQAIFPIVQMIVISTWEAIKGAIQGAIEVITGIIQFFAALFTGNWSALWDAVKQILSGAVKFLWNIIQVAFVGRILKAGQLLFKGLRSVMSTMWNAIKSLFSGGVNVVRSVVNAGFNFIRSIVTSVMNVIRSIVSSVWNAIRSVVSSVVNTIRSVITSGFNTARSIVTSVVNTIRSVVSSVFNALRGIVSGAMNGVRSAVRSGITGALSVVTGMASRFLQAGRNIVTSIADGIKGAIGKVTGAISNVASKIRSFLPFSPAKEGALKDIMNIQIAQSIAKSIDKGQGVAVKSMANLSSALYDELPNIDIAGNIARTNASIQSSVSHELNRNNSRIESLLEKIANNGQVIVLDSGELVGATYNNYNRLGGNQTVLSERWGR